MGSYRNTIGMLDYVRVDYDVKYAKAIVHVSHRLAHAQFEVADWIDPAALLRMVMGEKARLEIAARVAAALTP